jgi:type VI secretion system protein ImpM
MSRQALSQPRIDASPSVPGWFGKVVMLGDFAHRRLPPEFISTCDQWLSQCISASRVQLGSRWLDTYLTGPVWRFAWAPGVADAHWWFGVLMPSVDAVGRYFPLVVCATDQNPPMSDEALNKLSSWYAHASQAALATLAPRASLEGFEAELAQAPAWQAVQAAALPELETAAKRQRLVLHGAPTLAQWAHALASPLITNTYAGHSFWFALPADGSDIKDSSLTVVPGLPDPDQFSLMLEGRW